MTRLPMTVLIGLVLVTAVTIPIMVFQISKLKNSVLTFKPRPVNDTSYLSRFYQVQYRDLKNITNYLKDLVSSYTFFCNLQVVSYTSKKGALPQNPIYVMKISSGYPKPIILIIGGIYANDWKSSTSILYIANQLLSNCTTEGQLVTMYDWYLVPILNPDGYNYSQSMPAAKTWIKNIAQWSMDYLGVNLNYNFAFYWKKGYNFNENTYPGTRPFSEAESQALRNLVMDLEDYIELVYLLMSPIGKMSKEPVITYPWSYSAKKPKNWVLMEYLALEGSRAAKNATGTRYRVMQSSKLVPNQTGRIDDWLKGCTIVEKVLTVHSDFVANLIRDPYESITKMGTEVFAIVRAISLAMFEHPKSYRKTHKRINVNEIVTVHSAGPSSAGNATIGTTCRQKP